MAKKKTSQRKEAAPMAEETKATAPRDPSPDMSGRLKQLNEILLKETKEKREQVSQLQSQIEEMCAEFSFASETERETLHVVLSAFLVNLSVEINGRLREMEVERMKEVEKGRVLEGKVESLREEVQTEMEKGRLAEKEKILILGQLDVKEKEAVEMEKMAKDLEMVKSEIERRFFKVCEEKEALLKEGHAKEQLISHLRNEKDVVESSLAECKKLVEKLKTKIEDQVKERELKMGLLENEKEVLEAKIVSLEQEHAIEIRMLSSQMEGLHHKNAEKEREIRDLKATIDGTNQKIVGLEKEIDILQLAMEEANKKGGFRSWIYPAATTILAAISFLYAARAR